MAALIIFFHVALAAGKTTLRVCAGSSCAGRCVGAFEPVRAFRAQAEAPCTRADVTVETVLCMNMCVAPPSLDRFARRPWSPVRARAGAIAAL